MALTNYSDRDISSILINQSTSLGPGSYNADKSLSILEQRVKSIKAPPFGKGSGITTQETNSNLNQKFTPGPGQYEQHTSFNQKIMSNEKQKGYYFLVKNGMLERKTEWLSADKTKKIDIIQQTSSYSPGPGAYSPRDPAKSSFTIMNKGNSKQKIVKGQFLSQQKTQQLVLTKVPSIPSKNQQLIIQPQVTSGNQTNLNLSSQQIIAAVQINKSQNNISFGSGATAMNTDPGIGPGKYDPQIITKKNFPASTWVKSGQQRKLWFEENLDNQKKQFQTYNSSYQNLGNQDNIPGEGFENDEQNKEVQEQMRQQREKRLAKQFGNKRWRTTKGRPFSIGDFDQKYGMMNKDGKKENIDENDESEDNDSIDYKKDQTPGPGHYYNSATYSSIKPQYKKEEFQMFGSTEDRFKGSVFQADNHHQGTSPEVGPGSYNLRSDPLKYQKRYRQVDIENKEVKDIKRIFDPDPETLSKPGPGNYESKENAFSKKKDFQKPFQSAFGSSDSRKITTIEETLSPGPGSYIQDKKTSKEKINTSIFKSQTKRSIENFLIGDPNMPSAADYNLQHYKGTSYQQLQGGAPNNILVLKRAVQKQGEKFDSSTLNTSKIISNKTTLDQYQNIGPGAYSPNIVERSIPKTKNTFGKSMRFNDQTKNLPGPGQYTNMPYTEPSDWHKRTFNLRYLQNGSEVMRSKSQLNNSVL